MAMAPASWLLLLLSLGILCCQKVGAQQTYNEPDQLGYVCSGTDSCPAYAAYTAGDGDTFLSIGSRFRLSADQVARASGLSTNAPISTGQLVLVPLNCSCVHGRSQFNTTYIIQKGDTMYLVSVNTFEGLTTWQAVVKANPNNEPTKLESGDQLIFPISCSCPSASQKQAGFQSLVTYSIGANKTIDEISQSWNLSTSELLSQNKDPDLAKNIRGNTALLLPIINNPPALPASRTPVPVAASPAPTVSSSPPVHISTRKWSLSTGEILGIAVASAAAAVLATLVILCICRVRNHRKTTPYSSSSDLPPPLNLYSNKNQYGEMINGIHMLDSDKTQVFSYTECCV